MPNKPQLKRLHINIFQGQVLGMFISRKWCSQKQHILSGFSIVGSESWFSIICILGQTDALHVSLPRIALSV
jgi:hypothetical protein